MLQVPRSEIFCVWRKQLNLDIPSTPNALRCASLLHPGMALYVGGWVSLRRKLTPNRTRSSSLPSISSTTSSGSELRRKAMIRTGCSVVTGRISTCRTGRSALKSSIKESMRLPHFSMPWKPPDGIRSGVSDKTILCQPSMLYVAHQSLTDTTTQFQLVHVKKPRRNCLAARFKAASYSTRSNTSVPTQVITSASSTASISSSVAGMSW